MQPVREQAAPHSDEPVRLSYPVAGAYDDSVSATANGGDSVANSVTARETLKAAGWRELEMVVVLDNRRQWRTVLIAPEGGR